MRPTRVSVLTGRLVGKYSTESTTTTENFLENRGEGAAGVANDTLNDIMAQVLQLDAVHLNTSVSSANINVQNKCLKEVGPEDLAMDPRLRAWNRVLEQRHRLQQRIERETGKRPEDVLFNRPTTIDEASKRMILRVLDTADRTRPHARVHEESVLDSLKPRCDPKLCREIRALYAAKPQVQPVEFIGLPQVTQEELAVTASGTVTESKFQRSEVLGQRIQSKKQYIQNVVEFAPEIDSLQVVPTEVVSVAETKPIRKIGVDTLVAVSDDSTEDEDSDLEEEEDKEQTAATDLDETKYEEGVLINGHLYDYLEMKGPNRKGIHLVLQCDPHQRVVKTLVDIQVKARYDSGLWRVFALKLFGPSSQNPQNLSRKLLHVYWASRNRFRTDHHPMEGELLFDRCEFILEPQERRQIRALFHPQIVGLTTQRWSLCLVKSPVCGTRRLMVVLQGQCTMPAPFQRRLEIHRQVPGEKQQRLQAHSIINMQASLAPIIENPPLLCPYQRVLDERELFNSLNPSYRCDRFADLEALKDLYALAKKPRDRPWDLSIEGLRRSINRQESRFMREKLHNELLDLLQPMQCNRCEALIQLEHNPERDRDCFIYVRGTISSAIDEWEKMALCLDEQFFKLELQRQQSHEQEESNTSVILEDILNLEKQMPTVKSITKIVRGNKYLKDSLYMQTYNILCDAAEDIVSVIESTTHR
ncbi:hypothetical protein KR032_009439 [Drosophila birchii]|nr:hypothetical protein KR032_009439 [Drosophila birchii]